MIEVPDVVATAFLLGVGTGLLIDHWVIPWMERVADRMTLMRLRWARRRER